MKIAITGHRPNKLGNDYDLSSILMQRINMAILSTLINECELDLSGEGEEVKFPNLTLITGMALGIDTLFANIAIANKIPFIAAIPFHGQQLVWPQKSIQIYADIIANPLCTVKVISPGGYSAKKMQIRNEWMVDNCDLLIAVWDESPGGTANCVKYAKSKNKKIIYINPNNYK